MRVVSNKKIIKKLEELSINSQVHPQHYLLHKYWGRKPHNLINEYLKICTNEEDVILDPFMGSGGVVIESNKLNRVAIGVDINPMSTMIVNETLKEIDLEKLKNTFNEILKKIPSEIKDIQQVSKNGEICVVENAVWSGEKLIRVKLNYKGKSYRRNANKEDLKKIKESKKLLEKYKNEITYPTNKIMKYVKRNQKETIDELFTSRNLLIAGWFLKQFSEVKDKNISSTLKFIFTSALPNFSNMIPGDFDKVIGKSGWQISKFWAPEVHAEKNVIISLQQRLDKFIKGKNEIDSIKTNTNYSVYNKSSHKLNMIQDNSIDFIFTDPPYGDSIAYLALSSFWNSWLRNKVDYSNEIIYDPYRNKKEEDYETRLVNSFSEMSRVLKKNKLLTMTFNNRHMKFWKIIMESCKSSGFELVNIKWVNQAVSSGTQGINRRNTLKGDFVYTFINTKKKNNLEISKIEGTEYIKETLESHKVNSNFITPAKLYESLIPKIINNSAYYDSSGKFLDVDNFMNKNFQYIQKDKSYGWQI